jgi:serine/threonine-protein kinase
MELLEGRDLDTHLQELEARRQAPSLAWLESTFTPIVKSLATAHDRGLVHPDLKAENIFLVDDARGGGVRLRRRLLALRHPVPRARRNAALPRRDRHGTDGDGDERRTPAPPHGLPDLSPDIDAWVQQALAIQPDDRFQSINGTWRALRNCFPGA